MATILVIDDDPLACDFAVRSLVNRGHEVIGATSSVNALCEHNVDEIDLIVTDIFMPEKDGLEVIMELRGKHPGVKVVAISGGGEKLQTNLLVLAEKLGAKRVLNKPCSPEDLRNVVDEVLAH